MQQNIKDIITQSVSTLPHKLSLANIAQLGDAAQLQYEIGDYVLNDIIHAYPEIGSDKDYEMYKDEFYALVGQDAENAWQNACKKIHLGYEESKGRKLQFIFADEIAGSFDVAFSTILEELELN